MIVNMKQEFGTQEPSSRLSRIQLPLAAAILMWLSQPPFSLWPLALVCLLPLFFVVLQGNRLSRADWFGLWIGGTLYWLASLQGLRHAHTLMFLGWFALSAYLATYWLLFVYASRWLQHYFRLPLGLSVAVAWVGQEYLRNYVLTGLSACMLGHTMAEVPVVMQIAAWTGSFGVSLFVVCVNLLIYRVITSRWMAQRVSKWCGCMQCCSFDATQVKRVNNQIDAVLMIAWITLVLLVGIWRLDSDENDASDQIGTFLLVQRSETVEYTQPTSRAIEIYQAYVRETLDAIAECGEPVNAVIWPESMYTAGNPWMEIAVDEVHADSATESPLAYSAAVAGLSPMDLRRAVAESQNYFQHRSQFLTEAVNQISIENEPIDFLVGCGVLRYAEQPEVYCGLVQFGSQGKVKQWYGKNHLVMFGEYIPIISAFPFLQSILPPGMGLNRGQAPEPMQVGTANLLPNICIETAVEHVAVNHLNTLRGRGQTADALVTVTNDGWFDQSSVLEHHLRCAQFVAVAAGLPIMSSANSGPTAWIDSYGRIQKRLELGTNGYLLAKPTRPAAETFYSRFGNWPALICGLLTTLPLMQGIIIVIRRKRSAATSG